MIWDVHPGSRIRIFSPFRIPDPGSMGQKATHHITKNINKFQKENVTILLNKNIEQYSTVALIHCHPIHIVQVRVPYVLKTSFACQVPG